MRDTPISPRGPVTAHRCELGKPPPIEPRIMFIEKHLEDMALWGSMGITRNRSSLYSLPPHWTTSDMVGRWTLHFDLDLRPFEEIIHDETPWRLLHDLLPGMRMKYTDLETARSWVWVLTDQVVQLEAPYRLGVWPD